MHFFISTHLQVNPNILNLWLIIINHSPGLWLTRLIFLIDWQHYFIPNIKQLSSKSNKHAKINCFNQLRCVVVFVSISSALAQTYMTLSALSVLAISRIKTHDCKGGCKYCAIMLTDHSSGGLLPLLTVVTPLEI